jgi:hypothetical protein
MSRREARAGMSVPRYADTATYPFATIISFSLPLIPDLATVLATGADGTIAAIRTLVPDVIRQGSPLSASVRQPLDEVRAHLDFGVLVLVVGVWLYLGWLTAAIVWRIRALGTETSASRPSGAARRGQVWTPLRAGGRFSRRRAQMAGGDRRSLGSGVVAAAATRTAADYLHGPTLNSCIMPSMKCG